MKQIDRVDPRGTVLPSLLLAFTFKIAVNHYLYVNCCKKERCKMKGVKRTKRNVVAKQPSPMVYITLFLAFVTRQKQKNAR